ncbi:interleukin-21, partial [Platichthys flesus]|uniref:interleukin-21 n=1 Tax=Platichthys flesus TaxID=8260 RepID=UPI002DB7E90A
EVPSSCSFLLAALSLRVHAHASIGTTHAPLDATFASRSGDCQWKRKLHYSHPRFLQVSKTLLVVFLRPQGYIKEVCCCSLGFAGSNEKKKLTEVLNELKHVRETLPQNSRTMLNSPPHDIEDCCYRAALQCFHANLRVHFNGTSRYQKKLNRSLNNTLTKRGVEYCPSGNNTATICHNCDLQPKVSIEVFFDRLKSLIEKALSRLGSK